MKALKEHHRNAVGRLATLAFCLLLPLTALCQADRLGIVKYAAPKGWTKTDRDNIVAFSELKKTGGFCIITLYGATPGTGSPQGDFRREWNNLVVKTLNADANPKTEAEAAEGGWTVVAGGAIVDFQSSPAFAFLTVISGGGKAVSILGVFNEETYLSDLTAFTSGVELDEAVADVPIELPQVVGPPAASMTGLSMHAAALVKEFENNEIRANLQYVGKRIRIHGIINTIEINRAGQIVLTFKSSITTRNNARCYFDKSQGAGVARLTANEEGTVEGTVKGLGDGFEGAKAFLVLEDCVVP